MRQKAALHRIREDATQTSVDTLNGAFGEQLSGHRILLLTKFSVKVSEMFGLEVGQLVAAQARHEAVNILLVAGQGGFCQLIWSNFPQPHLGISCESDGLIHLHGLVAALALEERSFFFEPFFFGFWCQIIGWMYGFLLGLAAFAIEIIAHGYDQQVAVPSFTDARHTVNLLSVVICPVEATSQYHTLMRKSSGEFTFYHSNKMCVLCLFVCLSFCRYALWSKASVITCAARFFSSICGWQ